MHQRRWNVAQAMLLSATPCCFCLVPLHHWIRSPALQKQASESSVPHPRRSLMLPAAWTAPQSCTPPAETNGFYFPDPREGNYYSD